MLELVPISNDNSCTACGHTRKASEAFITEFSCPDCMTNNKVYPSTSGYRNKNRKNITAKTRSKPKKTVKRLSSSISGQQILSWLGGAALILTIAITFKTFDNAKATQATIEMVSYHH